MLQQLYPREYVDSTYVIDFEEFYQKGYRGIIFDIDNTLVGHGEPADDRAKELFERLKKIGFQTLMLSNNKEPRVKMFCEAVDAPYIYKAGKPSPKGYQKAMELMGTTTENTLFVGDQIFTDVWGANQAKLYSVLVKPLYPSEEIQIVLKRYLEKIVLFCYKRYRQKCERNE